MDILVSGSMAYDRIMDFEGKFSDHILPDQLDNINVSFTVNSLTENFGGTAGNIAYSLSLLGEKPRILATIGQDYHRYFEWLERIGVPTGDIRVVEEELTAGAYITSDTQNNQITGFNPGAMKQQSGFDFETVDPKDCLAIVAPGNLGDMADYTAGSGQGHRPVAHAGLQRLRDGDDLQHHRHVPGKSGRDGGDYHRDQGF